MLYTYAKISVQKAIKTYFLEYGRHYRSFWDLLSDALPPQALVRCYVGKQRASPDETPPINPWHSGLIQLIFMPLTITIKLPIRLCHTVGRWIFAFGDKRKVVVNQLIRQNNLKPDTIRGRKKYDVDVFDIMLRLEEHDQLNRKRPIILSITHKFLTSTSN